MRRALLVLAPLLLLACATGSEPSAPVGRLRVTTDAGAPLYDAQATFVLRNPERVIGVKPYGEIHVGVEGDASRCRLVWSKDGLAKLHVLEGARCPHAEGDRVCFERTRFDSNGHVPALTVTGCAYENDLKWSKLQGAREATVGPTAWRTRCVELPARAPGCEIAYVALVDVRIAESDAPREGFSFAYQADAWRVCFAERDSGAYAIALDVEDTCGASGRVDLRGDSRELDD